MGVKMSQTQTHTKTQVFSLVREIELAELSKHAMYSTYDADVELDFDKVRVIYGDSEYSLGKFIDESVINFIAIDGDKLHVILTHPFPTKNVVVFYEFRAVR